MSGLEFGVRDGSEYDTEDAECLDNGEFAVTAGEFVEDITPSPLPVQKPAARGCQSSDTVVARSLGEHGVTLGWCRFILLLVGGLGEPDCVELQQPEFVPRCGRHNEAGVGMSLVNTDPELHEAQHAEWPNMCAVIEKQVVI